MQASQVIAPIAVAALVGALTGTPGGLMTPITPAGRAVVALRGSHSGPSRSTTRPAVGDLGRRRAPAYYQAVLATPSIEDQANGRVGNFHHQPWAGRPAWPQCEWRSTDGISGHAGTPTFGRQVRHYRRTFPRRTRLAREHRETYAEVYSIGGWIDTAATAAMTCSRSRRGLQRGPRL